MDASLNISFLVENENERKKWYFTFLHIAKSIATGQE